jgi:trehalose 2-sulfotransferase
MTGSAASSHGSQPLLSCVVASTPGTGSSFLCRGLARTGIVGQPDEYIDRSLYRSLATQWGYAEKGQPATTRVERAMLHTATPNGVFALHAHWYDFALLLRTIRNTAGSDDLLGHVDRLLASPRYVHVSRGDTAAQALSYYGAIFTGDADVRSDAPPDPDRAGPEPVILEQVRWLEDLLIDWDAQWQAYFARCDIRPLEVAYEDLAANYGPTIDRVLEYLGLTWLPGAADLEAPDRTLPSDWPQRWLDEYRAGRDRLASQPAEESWSRRDQIFEVTRTTEPPGPVGTGGATSSTSRLEDEVVYSCVVDKPPLLVYQSLIWVLTLTHLAGLAPQRLVVHVVEGTDPDHLTILRSLGVRVVPVARFDERNVYANKLRQLTAGALVDASAAVLCDCDIAFVGDITPFTGGDVIRGRAVGSGVPTLAGWCRLISQAGLTRELPLGRATGQMLTWTCAQNLNGGLLVIPRRFHDQLAEAWPRWFGWVLDHGDELAADVNRYAGQVSFGLALIELGLPVGWMPVGTNYGSFGDGFPWGEAEATFTGTVSPLGLHYHTRLTSAGRLTETGVPAVDATVAKVNALLDEPASREILEVALRNWQASLDAPASRPSKLGPRRLLSRTRNP